MARSQIVKTNGIYKKELIASAVNLQYGDVLPKPEVFSVEVLCSNYWRTDQTFKITAGTKEKQVTFLMRVFLSKTQGKYLVVISGDLCFRDVFKEEYINTFTDNDVCLVLFDRTGLAHDLVTYDLT